ncbi:MAG: hypothetical protein QNJ17_00480 [Desulfocapsaceae bacterium]|nr:hypothetical protein [Desulfocapsaceae bacterium]
MMNIEHGKLIPVSGNNNTPDMENAVDVQFNPVTLKVTLSNTLKENERGGSSRAAQFVDKSSSSLAVELLFDTTYINADEGESQDDIEQGSDVRDQTKKIAERFVKPVEAGEEMEAPKRCLFQWGSFEFVGMVENYEETLDYFSKEGRPLRAKVVLKLKEDRYQFRQRSDGVADAQQDTPTLSPTGNNDDGNSQHTNPVPGGSKGAGNWRDTALYNGIENPRLPDASVLAIPKVSAGASLGLQVGGGIGANSTFAAQPPAFSFGASANLGTKVAGAFTVGASSIGTASVGASSLQDKTTTLSSDSSINVDVGVGFE